MSLVVLTSLQDWLLKWCSATHIHLFGWQSKLHTSFEMTKFEDIDAKPSQSSPHIQYESHLDNCITLFHAKLSECTEAINLSHWINCLVWDAMSAVTVRTLRTIVVVDEVWWSITTVAAADSAYVTGRPAIWVLGE